MPRGFGQLAAMLLGCTLLAGCSKEAKFDRVPVTGRVTVDGAPLAFGSILFTPDGAAKGPRAGGAIRDGAYSIPQESGPLAGELLVQIYAPKLAPGKQLPAEDSERFRVAAESDELLPARYNSATTLRQMARVEGPNQFDFDLKTTPQP